jgi:thiamine transport system permease protein
MNARTLVYALPLVFLTVFFLYPLGAILRLSFGASGGLAQLLADGYYLEIIWFSAWQAALSTGLTLALGLPAAYVFARYEFAGKPLLRALATVPFVLPTVVVAVGFGALVGPRGLLNELLARALGLAAPPIRLDQTLALVLLAHVFYNYGVVVRIVGSRGAGREPPARLSRGDAAAAAAVDRRGGAAGIYLHFRQLRSDSHPGRPAHGHGRGGDLPADQRPTAA